jgi:hypothetical protein
MKGSGQLGNVGQNAGHEENVRRYEYNERYGPVLHFGVDWYSQAVKLC